VFNELHQTNADSSNGCCAEAPTLNISPQKTFVRLNRKGKPNILPEEAHFRNHCVALAMNKLNKTLTGAGF
jgi:hypothetical protein